MEVDTPSAAANSSPQDLDEATRVDTPSAAANSSPLDPDEATRMRRLKGIFFTLSAVTLIINLDGGGVPAALTHIQMTFEMQPWQLGILGALVYVGQAAGCVLCGPILRKFSPARVCQLALVLNTLATFLFAMAQNTVWLLISRFMIGVLQAAPAVYFPVWVDEFGPESSRTAWMAAIQAGAPLGIMLGYVFAGVMTTNPADTFGWRVPFLAQSGVLFVFALASPVLPKTLFDIGASGRAQRTVSMVSEPVSPPRLPVGQDSQISICSIPEDETSVVEGRQTWPQSGKLSSKAPSHTPAGAVTQSGPLPGSGAVASDGSPTGRTARASRWNAPVASSRQSITDSLTESMDYIVMRASYVAQHMPHGNQIDQFSVQGRDRLNSGSSLVSVKEALQEALSPSRKLRASEAGGGASARREHTPSQPLDSAAGERISVDEERPESLKPPNTGPPALSTAAAVRQLVRSRVYMCVVGSMAALFFVVTGIQFWVTAYLVDVLGAPQGTVVGVFAGVSITAPVLGVAVGSIVVDQLGGYQGSQGVARTLKVDAAFTVLAAAAAFSTNFVPPADGAFWTVVGLICVTLFFGGCVIPSATGVLMEVAAPDARPVASAGSMFCFQLLGYAMAPLVSAIVMEMAGCGTYCDDADDPSVGNVTNASYVMPPSSPPSAPAGGAAVVISPKQLKWGFRTVMTWGVFGATFMILAWRGAENELRAKQMRKKLLENNGAANLAITTQP